MILKEILPRTSVWKPYIYRTFKISRNLKGYTLMSGNEESFLPAEPDEPVVKKTLATDVSLKVSHIYIYIYIYIYLYQVTRLKL